MKNARDQGLVRHALFRRFSSYQPLLRAYVGQGLRRDLETLEGSGDLSEFIDSLARHGVDEAVIAEAMAEIKER